MLKSLMISVSAVALCASTVAFAEPSQELIDAAKKEGMLTTIALPHSWCGYGEVIAGFKAKYPEITVNELNPDAGSADEIEAVKANIGNTGPQAPDVLDVGFSYGPQLVEEGLAMPYKVSTWDSIPAEAKHPDGYWYGDYYGVMAFEVNKELIPNPPQDWPDLLKPEYANSVALGGEPRTSNQGILGIYASGLSRSGGDPAKAAEEGLKFWAEVSKAGNFVPATGRVGPLAQGATPIIIRWDYNALADKVELAGNPEVEVIVPPTGVLAGVYIQAISAHAPHPNAAKLWMEYLYSDEGQLLWLKGFCHPIRFNDLVASKKVPQELLDALPPAENYAKAFFPTLEQQKQANEVITKQWDSVVGVEVAK